MVLYQRIHHRAVGGERRNLVGSGDDDLSIQNVIVCIVATVDHEREVHHQSGGVAVAVGAGVGFVGREAVVGEKLVSALSVDDDASAGTLNFGGDISPSADEIEVVVLLRVGINRDRIRENGPIGVLGVFLATLKEGEEEQ